MKNIYIVVGGIRPHWLGQRIAQWVRFNAKRKTNDRYIIVDIKDIERDKLNISDADAFIVIAPEYSFGTPNRLRSAVRTASRRAYQVPVAFVSYGQSKRSGLVESFRKYSRSLCLVPIRRSVHLAQPWDAIDQKGEVHNESALKELSLMLNQLLSMSAVTAKASTV